MKYWSEILEKLFDDEKALQEAEQEHENKQKEKDIMYDRVVDALKRSEAAKKEYLDLRSEYVKKYGSFAYKYEKDINPNTFPFNIFF